MKDFGAYEEGGHKDAFDWKSFGEQTERILHGWKLSVQSSGSPSWNKSVGNLKFDDSEFRLTRHWKSGISEERGSGNDNQGDKKETIEIPKAWLDMVDKSNMFPRHDAHPLHTYFGLKDFIVLEPVYIIKSLVIVERLIRELSLIAHKTDWHVPLFLKNEIFSDIFDGILEWNGYRTSFRAADSRCKVYRYGMGYFHYMFKSEVVKKDVPVTVSVRLTYSFHEQSDYPDKKIRCAINFGVTEIEYDCVDVCGLFANEFELCATWSDPMECNFSDNTNQSDLDPPEDTHCDHEPYNERPEPEYNPLKAPDWVLDPLDAPDWSVRVRLADTSDVPMGDCLMTLLSLCTSTQIEPLASNPQISSMLKYRRMYKQKEGVTESLAMQGLTEPKVRKVTSKFVLKPEESLIPIESLNSILDFLFCDAKLHYSNGTATRDGYEVENKFFLTYKELSKYFQSAQLSSLISRLAICICIVNKYHGGIGAVNQLWKEFVLEMKYCVDNNCEIKGLEPVKTTLNYEKLLQKLQILNSCIEKNKSRDASSLITNHYSNIKSNTEISRDDFMDISELPSCMESIGQPEASEECVDISGLSLDEESSNQSEDREGTSTIGPHMRVKTLFDHLMSDKKAFKDINPGCVLGDFVSWCSCQYFMDEMVMDEGYNEGHLRQRIKLSDEVTVLIKKSAPTSNMFLEDDAMKVLLWLDSLKASDMVFGFMPVLMHSTVTTLLEHTEILQFPFLKDHLYEIEIKLKELGSIGAPECDSSDWIKRFEGLIHQLMVVEERMAKGQHLLKMFRHFDPSHTVGDLELQKFVCELLQFGEASVLRSSTERPSNTKLGRIIYKFFLNGCKKTSEVVKEPNPDTGATLDQVDKLPKPLRKEYIFKYDNSDLSDPESYQRLYLDISPNKFCWGSAYTLDVKSEEAEEENVS